jgi:hypothetical protein
VCSLYDVVDVGNGPWLSKVENENGARWAVECSFRSRNYTQREDKKEGSTVDRP